MHRGVQRPGVLEPATRAAVHNSMPSALIRCTFSSSALSRGGGRQRTGMSGPRRGRGASDPRRETLSDFRCTLAAPCGTSRGCSAIQVVGRAGNAEGRSRWGGDAGMVASRIAPWDDRETRVAAGGMPWVGIARGSGLDLRAAACCPPLHRWSSGL